MKPGFAIVFIIIAVCLMVCAVMAGRSSKKIAGAIRKLLGAASIAALANHVIIITETEPMAIAAYTLFFISIIWMLYYLLRFTVEYCNYEVVGVVAHYRLVMLLAVIVVLDMIYVFWGMPVDISIIFFTAAGFAVYYGALIHKPEEVIHKALARVVQDMGDAVLLFDMDGHCLGINAKAQEMYGVTEDDTAQIEQDFARWYQYHKDEKKIDYIFQVTRFKEDRNIYLKIHAKRLMDKKQRFLGVFFVVQDRTEEVEKIQSELYRAQHDSLTGLYNREYFYESAARCLRENPDEAYIMVCSDVRNFKLVNDVFGAGAGDEILIKIGKALRSLTKEGEIFGRLGDDRFGLLMKKKDFREEIFINEPAKVVRMEGDNSFPLNVYIGVYEISDKNMPVSVMCDRAFMAISTIKGNSQVKVAYYDDTLRKNVLREQKLSGEMAEAMEDGQFQLYLQPQVTAEGKVIGGEALIRWTHPEEGMIMPGEFVPIFEKNGMIAKLDYYIWETACKYLKKWKERGKEEFYISVNVSMRDFYFMDIYKVFTELVEKYEIPPHNLKLEITETAVMMDLKKQQGLIRGLRESGFVVEMDDFGSGYSSLNMLKDIFVDVLKVDMAFLEKGGDQKRGRAILRTISQLSRRLGMPVIIEGVEDAEQVEFLKMIGCDMFQGYYFAKPMPIVEFEEKYM